MLSDQAAGVVLTDRLQVHTIEQPKQVQLLQDLLREPVASAEELLALESDALTRLIGELKHRLRSRES